MSGPYPPGYPHPQDHGGWGHPGQSGPHRVGGQYGGQFGGNPVPPRHPAGYGEQAPFGPGQPRYEVANDFPTIRYSGLATPPGGWGGGPPRKRRGAGRVVVAVIAVLVIIGGIATGIVLVTGRNAQRQAAQAGPSTGIGATTTGQRPQARQTTAAPSDPPTDPGQPNGSTTLNLAAGACVTAQVAANAQYMAVRQVSCGTAQSDFVLAVSAAAMTGCADHQYLRLTAPDSGVYCFTLDIRPGDCVDDSYLKAPCGSAPYVVLRTEPGPGGSSSCTDAVGATRWVPVGRNPVRVGCLGPAKS
jgi:hypothetical protein